MSDRNDIEETMEMQESVVTDPAMERAMPGESPMRTIVELLGVNQMATGNVQYVLKRSARCRVRLRPWRGRAQCHR
jgi:hypothetical protein